MTRSFAARGAVLGLFLFASAAGAQQLVVGSGSQLLLGSGVLEAGCADVHVAGTLDIGSGSLRGARDVRADGALRGGSGVLALSGNLDAASGLLPQSGTVRIESGCGRAGSSLIGNHQFNRLTVENTAAFALTLPAGGTQAIATALVLRGGVERLVLRSSTPGALSLLSLTAGASQSIQRVDVMDVGAPTEPQSLAPVDPASIDSIDRGNSPFFFLGEFVGNLEPLVIPTLSTLWLGVLLSLMALLAVAYLRGRPSAG